MPPAEEGSPLDWATHEEEILDLLLAQDKTLKEVVKYMSEKYKFEAKQYKYRFARLKNVTAAEYADIDAECKRREALGKRTDVCLLGRTLPPERVKRGIDRVRKNTSTSGFTERRSNRELLNCLTAHTVADGPRQEEGLQCRQDLLSNPTANTSRSPESGSFWAESALRPHPAQSRSSQSFEELSASHI
ncbi:hypothetical protein C8A05DRAFT_16074 [Staphylotrichum tortipilum]|uniref:Clr5 domain-containing protein n=1 Tax=Staphylotrichum tortipilum TaxID=2831512 RepID=A0AAN6RT35_9PEZI|nr:hypothetical protein C8A05DRAFT_16074 [Staphylotrichum longicolle]